MADIRTSIDAMKDIDPFGLGSIAFGLAKTYVPFFLIAVLLAAVVKRKKSVEAPNKNL